MTGVETQYCLRRHPGLFCFNKLMWLLVTCVKSHCTPFQQRMSSNAFWCFVIDIYVEYLFYNVFAHCE